MKSVQVEFNQKAKKRLCPETVCAWTIDEGDEGKYFTITNNKKAHFIAPRLGFTAKIPLSDKLRFNFEGFANPVYFMILNQDMSYKSNQTVHPFDYSGDNSFTRFSSPFIDTKISLDFYGMFRVMSRLNYQRLDFQQLDWNEKFDGLKGYDDVQTIITLRFGFEVLSRYQKNAKIRGGIYRQMEWNKSSYLNTTEKEGKWIFSLGTEL